MIEPSWNVMLTGRSEPAMLDLLAVVVEQLDLRTHALRRRARAALRIDDDERRQAGHFVDLLRHRHAFLDVLELHRARVLGDDRTRGRVPRARAPCPPCTVSPSLTCSVAPYGTLWRSRSRPLSSWIITSPERAMTTSSPLRVGDVAHQRREAHRARRLRSRPATPPRSATPRRRCGTSAS